MTAGAPVRAALVDNLTQLHLPAMRGCFEESARRAEKETLSYPCPIDRSMQFVENQVLFRWGGRIFENFMAPYAVIFSKTPLRELTTAAATNQSRRVRHRQLTQAIFLRVWPMTLSTSPHKWDCRLARIDARSPRPDKAKKLFQISNLSCIAWFLEFRNCRLPNKYSGAPEQLL